jgi:hypothetical protein
MKVGWGGSLSQSDAVLFDGLRQDGMEGIVQKGEEAPRQGGEGEQDQQQSPPHEHLVNLLLHLGSRLCNAVGRYSWNVPAEEKYADQNIFLLDI